MIMNTMFKIMVTVCILGFLLALSSLGNEMFTGFTLAMGAVFFILSFITKVIEKAEAGA